MRDSPAPVSSSLSNGAVNGVIRLKGASGVKQTNGVNRTYAVDSDMLEDTTKDFYRGRFVAARAPDDTSAKWSERAVNPPQDGGFRRRREEVGIRDRRLPISREQSLVGHQCTD